MFAIPGARARRSAPRAAAVALVLALGLGLGSCAAQDPGRSESFHSSVVGIANHAASGDFAAARAALDRLEAEVADARADGELDETRARDIRDAIALVRADLEAAEAAATPTPTPTVVPDDDEDDGPGNGDDKDDDKGKDGDKGKGSGKD